MLACEVGDLLWGPLHTEDVNSTFQFQLFLVHTTLETGNSERHPYNFRLFWELLFFSMVSIGGGDVSGGGGLSLQMRWRGVGGAGRSPSPQMHSQNMQRDSASVRRILGALRSQFFVGSQKNILCP